MNFNSVKVWSVGVAILCVALLLGTVLLGAKPKFDEVAEMNTEREDVEFINDKLRAEVKKLRKMEEELPQTREEIAALQVGIPTQAKLDEFLIYMADLADDYDLTINTSKMDRPVSYTENIPEPTETPAPEPEDESGEAPEPVAPGEAEEPATATANKPAGEDLLQELYLLTFETEFTGTYENALAFIEELQVDSERHFLVFEISLEGNLEELEGEFGLPDLEVGDVGLSVKGTAYVLEGIEQPEDPDAEPAKEPKMPKPGANDNPFMPLENLPEQ